MNTAKLKSFALVIIQFSGIGFFVLTGPVFAGSAIQLVFKLFGFVLAIWAIWVMNPWKVSVFPEPRLGMNLITSGPYHWIRHPMYTSILIICGILTYERADWQSMIVMIILTINQILKLLYEEGLLEKSIEGYVEYKTRTKRLIPFVW